MHKTSLIGTKYKLKKEIPNLLIGSIGYVFYELDDTETDGTFIQVIFENGDFHGFSVDEQELYLEYSGYVTEYQDYDFKSVFQLDRDFQRGYWCWK